MRILLIWEFKACFALNVRRFFSEVNKSFKKYSLLFLKNLKLNILDPDKKERLFWYSNTSIYLKLSLEIR